MIYAYRRALPLIALVGLSGAVALRVQLAGSAGARSALAGVWFAAALAAVALATRDPERASGVRLRHVGVGVAGAVVLCAPAALRHVLAGRDVLPLDGYPSWAWIVAMVSCTSLSLWLLAQPLTGSAAK